MSYLQHDVQYMTGARYVAAMTCYLAFTSNFGESFRPILKPTYMALPPCIMLEMMASIPVEIPTKMGFVALV